MFKWNYSCNRAVIFEVAVFLLLSLFWTNHNANHQPPSPQRQPPTTFSTTTPTTNHLLHHANHQLPSPQPPSQQPHHSSLPSPQRTTSPHLHLRKRCHLCASHGEFPTNSIYANRCGGSLVGARAGDFTHVRVGDFTHVRSVHITRQTRIRITKGAGPAGGQR